ncbi:hypothetical protein OCOJLMKI_3853 [Methylobacterium iners]|uniref:Uncharacterized protein n=1 Tax=Methylobacterium iners TaxID=418707 RepID=A0ABQ4S4M1_9HYPH|nr:hypothetical protein OCOJLMKI_3853 [Methylobacterium iners]
MIYQIDEWASAEKAGDREERCGMSNDRIDTLLYCEGRGLSNICKYDVPAVMDLKIARLIKTTDNDFEVPG